MLMQHCCQTIDIHLLYMVVLFQMCPLKIDLFITDHVHNRPFRNVVFYERVCYERTGCFEWLCYELACRECWLLWTWSVMNECVLITSVMKVVCFEWCFMNRSILKGNRLRCLMNSASFYQCWWEMLLNLETWVVALFPLGSSRNIS